MVMWYLKWKVIISRTFYNTFQPFDDVKKFAFYQHFKMAAMKMSKVLISQISVNMDIKLMELDSRTLLYTSNL